MKKSTVTTTITEYPSAYPRTSECEKYLQLRESHEASSERRASYNFVAALGGTSGARNAVDNEEFRKVQYAYHDCQMTAMAFFTAKKDMINDVIVENANGFKKTNS